MTTAGGRFDARAGWLPLWLLAFAVWIATYFVARTGGLVAETDSATQAAVIRAALRNESLIDVEGVLYVNGYLYTAASAAIVAFTGVGVSALQQVIYPLLSVSLVLPAWALYRELCGSPRAAAIATLLLFTQPEFLFVVFRGSHERVLRFLMLAALWLLARSFRAAGTPSRFAAHVVLFYLLAFALVATNAFFGVSFFVAMGVAVVAAWTLQILQSGDREQLKLLARRLWQTAVGLAAIVFVFLFYLYPVATHSLGQFGLIAHRTAQLVLTTDTGASPYVQVLGAWTSRWVYFALALNDYLLMVVSAVVWLFYGRTVLAGWRGSRRGAPVPFPTTPVHGSGIGLLWLLYGGFAFQGAVAILSDRTGMLGANLQHRSFPSFAMLAAPVVATGLARLRFTTWRRVVAVLTLAVLTPLAMLKMTNEPSLSNKWTFYTAAERAALSWSDDHHQGESIWVGPDERLGAAALVISGVSPTGNSWDIYDAEPGTRVFLVSDAIRRFAGRAQRPLPEAVTENRVYDNGSAQVFRLRPRTAYQQ